MITKYMGLCLLRIDIRVSMQHIHRYSHTKSTFKSLICTARGSYYVSWYNAPVGEALNKRSVYATASNVRGPWSAPAVLFPTFTASDHGINEDGEENGPSIHLPPCVCARARVRVCVLTFRC